MRFAIRAIPVQKFSLSCSKMIYLDKSTVQIPTRLSMYALYLQSLQTCHHNSNLKPSGETEYGATQIPTSFVQIFRSGFVCSMYLQSPKDPTY